MMKYVQELIGRRCPQLARAFWQQGELRQARLRACRETRHEARHLRTLQR
jgi:hypothetical protein